MKTEKLEAVNKLVDAWANLSDNGKLLEHAKASGLDPDEIVKCMKTLLHTKVMDRIFAEKSVDLNFIDSTKDHFIDSFNNGEKVTYSLGTVKPTGAENFTLETRSATIDDELFESLKRVVKGKLNTECSKYHHCVFGVSIDAYKGGYILTASIYKQKVE